MYVNPCQPSPCGPNSQCREINNQAVCSCLPNYFGSPPGCRPECVVSSDCGYDKSCENQKCVDPCIGKCGQNARCRVNNHSPICYCNEGYTGDAFSRCYPQPRKNFIACLYSRFDSNEILRCLALQRDPEVPRDPCNPSPCGSYAQCRDSYGSPSCSCLPNYMGSPPNCRPECTINSECASNKACMNEKCRDPCPGSCGLNAQCEVINHTPICSCQDQYTGDPFTNCYPKPLPRKNLISRENFHFIYSSFQFTNISKRTTT